MARVNRRDVLRGFGLGALGLALSGKSTGPSVGSAAPGSRWVKKNGLFRNTTTPAKVCLVKGNDCRDIVYQALKKIEDQVITSIGDKKILIKPNFVITSRQLAATHVDAVRGILDFLKPHYKNRLSSGNPRSPEEALLRDSRITAICRWRKNTMSSLLT